MYKKILSEKNKTNTEEVALTGDLPAYQRKASVPQESLGDGDSAQDLSGEEELGRNLFNETNINEFCYCSQRAVSYF